MAIKDEESRPVTSSDPMRAMFDDIYALKLSRNNNYIDSPINILPDRYWLSQIVIKAVRAEQANTPEKRIEELDDVIVYCFLEKMKTAGMRI